MTTLKYDLKTAEEATQFAKIFAQVCSDKNVFNQGVIVYLEGDLGAGKSHFSRGVIQHFLPEQKVKSPTYTIVESYNFSTNCIYHLDLYRLCDSEELEYLAIRDLFSDSFMALVEWPSKGIPVLPEADLVFHFKYEDFSGVEGRSVMVEAKTALGEQATEALQLAYK